MRQASEEGTLFSKSIESLYAVSTNTKNPSLGFAKERGSSIGAPWRAHLFLALKPQN
jgi:hypothetical protein